MKYLVVLLLALSVGACGNLGNTTNGVGFGSGEDDYKESPCACVELPQKFKRYFKKNVSEDHGWIRSTRVS